jgi:ABC-type antimicrobial peptide transport system permease subunit
MIVREGLLIGVPGVIIGIPSALAGARLVRSQATVCPNAPSTIIGASVIFVLAVLLASLVPALRASKTIRWALRQE